MTYIRVGVDNGAMMAVPLDRNLQPSALPVTVQTAGADTPRYNETPRLAWNGSTYDVAWVGRADDPRFPNRYLARLTRSGHLAAPRVDLGPISGDETPFIFGLSDGKSVLAYSRMVPELGGSARVVTRLVEPARGRAVGR